MIEIKDLLLRLNNILLNEETKKVIICDILNNNIGTKLTTKDIKIKNGTLYLNIKPILKNEIFLKKDLINKKLQEALGGKAPSEIR